MTALLLQQDLIAELEKILKNMQFQSEETDEEGNIQFTPFQFFLQSLPIRDEEDYDPFPYIIVRVEEGSITDENFYQEVIIKILIGIYNNEKDTNGHQDVLNVIQKIYERFAKNPVLKEYYWTKNEMEWALQSTDSYPYYFGGMKMTWFIKKIEIESEMNL